MALFKELSLANGVTVRYHRIVSLNCITNVCNLIEVASYTGQNKRDEEKTALAAGEPMNVFIDTTVYAASYKQDMTITDAYAFLKALSRFQRSRRHRGFQKMLLLSAEPPSLIDVPF